MSFGRDREGLAKVTGWRAQGARYTGAVAKKKRTGGGGGARYRDAYWPVEDSVDRVRMVPGEYEVEIPLLDANGDLVVKNEKPQSEKMTMLYYPYDEHRDNTTGKTTICSGGVFKGYRDYRQPCRGCDRYFEESSREGGKWTPGPVSRRTLYAFNVWNFAKFAHAPQLDRETGSPRMNPETNEPYMEWRAIRKGEEKKYKEYEQEDGRLLHWAMGATYQKNLAAKEAAAIGGNCMNCGEADSIEILAYLCPNCQNCLVEIGNTDMDLSEIKEYLSRTPTCPECDEKVVPAEHVECKSCGDEAQRATIFDVEMRITKVQTGVNKNGDKEFGLNIEYAWPPNETVEDFTSQLKNGTLPLAEIYAPTPWDKQLEILGEVRKKKTTKTRSYS